MATNKIYNILIALFIWLGGTVLGVALANSFNNEGDWIGLGYFLKFTVVFLPAYIASYILVLKSIDIREGLKFRILTIVLGVLLLEPIGAFSLFIGKYLLSR